MSLVDLTIEDGVGLLVLNDPATRNALTETEMLAAIMDGIRRTTDEGRVLVITGAGSAFSAGGNVKDMAARTGLFSGTPEEILEGYRTTIQQLTRAIADTDLVTIAAVNGPAVGAGFDLVLGCDLRLGSPSARFSHSFVDLGIIPGDGGAWLLAQQLGWQRAAELSFTGRVVEAQEAVALGILLEVTDDVVTRAKGLAAEIAAKPSHALRLTKRLLRQARAMSLDGFLEYSAALQAVSHHTAAHHEAVAGFVERLKNPAEPATLSDS